jgi:hypothetical protein
MRAAPAGAAAFEKAIFIVVLVHEMAARPSGKKVSDRSRVEICGST